MDSSMASGKPVPSSELDITPLLLSLHNIDRARRDETVQAYQAFNRASVMTALTRMLSHAEGDIRCDAAEAVLRIDRLRGIDAVLPLLNDREWLVRSHVCGLLHDFGDERATELLTTVLLEDPYVGVRYMAAFALGEIGDARAMPALQHAVAFDNGVDDLGYHVRDAAEEAIEAILARQ